MYRIFLIGCFILLGHQVSKAQFEENFDSALSDWSGNIDHFIVNADNALQLNATDAGNSVFYQSVQYTDSMVFEIYLNLTFAPSANNKLRWYIWSENADFDQANAYYFEIGENGSDDALSFYSRQDGTETLLGKGKIGGVSDSPDLFVRVVLLSNENWEVSVDYGGGRFPETEFSFQQKTDFSGTIGFHGISLFYTSSRTDGFIFDDWRVQNYTEDISAPELLEFNVETNTNIKLVFDEAILESSVTASNFSIHPGLLQPLDFILDNNVLTLIFDALPEGAPFELNIAGISDLNGNVVESLTLKDLLYAGPPAKGELLINEILFNPKGNGSDYVEIYNNTNKYLDVSNVEIHNLDNGQSNIIGQDLIIFPHEIVAFSEDNLETTASYNPPDTAVILQSQLPSFNNDKGNVSLIFQGNVLDSFDYTEELHNPVINDPDGVSLERINPDIDSNTASNWTSAASTSNYGTPGYGNTFTLTPGDPLTDFKLRTTSFSPNNDGLYDFLILDYALEKSGYVATIKIYDEKGNLVKILANNVTLAGQGFFTWNGLNDDNIPARVGLYIVVVNIFHPDGDAKNLRMAASLNRQTR